MDELYPTRGAAEKRGREVASKLWGRRKKRVEAVCSNLHGEVLYSWRVLLGKLGKLHVGPSSKGRPWRLVFHAGLHISGGPYYAMAATPQGAIAKVLIAAGRDAEKKLRQIEWYERATNELWYVRSDKARGIKRRVTKVEVELDQQLQERVDRQRERARRQDATETRMPRAVALRQLVVFGLETLEETQGE